MRGTLVGFFCRCLVFSASRVVLVPVGLFFFFPFLLSSRLSFFVLFSLGFVVVAVAAHVAVYVVGSAVLLWLLRVVFCRFRALLFAVANCRNNDSNQDDDGFAICSCSRFGLPHRLHVAFCLHQGRHRRQRQRHQHQQQHVLEDLIIPSLSPSMAAMDVRQAEPERNGWRRSFPARNDDEAHGIFFLRRTA